MNAENVEFYLLGYLNCNVGAHVFDHPNRALTTTADLCGLHQLTNEPTRITEKTSTTIDLIFVNEPDKIVCFGVSHVSHGVLCSGTKFRSLVELVLLHSGITAFCS